MNNKHTAAQIVIGAIEQTITDMIADPEMMSSSLQSVTDPACVRDVVVGGEMVHYACNEIGASVQLRTACVRYMVRVLGWSKIDASTAAQI